MSDLNHCSFIGRLGKDPEVRYAASGTAIANFSIACGWKTKEKEGTEWVRCTAFGKLAEIVGEYCKKGKQVFVSGRLSAREWEDKEGVKRYTTEINVDQLQLLGSRDDGERPARQPAAQQSKPKAQGFDEMSDDIPFDRPFRGTRCHVV